jgi:hypothetical protein
VKDHFENAVEEHVSGKNIFFFNDIGEGRGEFSFEIFGATS